jgi:DNA-binding NarL/FixJ family response regulator
MKVGLMNTSDEYILLVGLRNHCGNLVSLPDHLCMVDTGLQAMQQIRYKQPMVLASRWDLPDMPDGLLFRRILNSPVCFRTLALVSSHDPAQEVTARSIGISVVLDETIDSEQLKAVLRQLSKLRCATGT